MMIDWAIDGVSFGNCNCDYSCPCQFESKPTFGGCHGIGVMRIDNGYFGDIRLDVLLSAAVYRWPGPIYEGKGEFQAIIDARADARQRDALLKILSGEETEEAATHWWVFRAMADKIHPPLFSPIAFDIDIAARTATVDIPGVLRATGRPIRSPVTGEDHRVRIDLPSGIEFEIAEIGSASTQSDAAIRFILTDSYGQFNWAKHTGKGLVRKAARA